MDAPAKMPGHPNRRQEQESNADGKRKPPRRRADQGEAKKKPKRPKKPSRQELAQQVSQELVKLRPILKDIGTGLLDRLDGEIAGLSRWLAGEGLSGDAPNMPPAPILSGMLADIQALKVKTKKGRVKDLGRIEALLESLSGRMPPEA